MFWGLIMEPGRCYTQTVKASFHVSMAALDMSNSSDDPAQVMCVSEGRNYLLCTLNKRDKIQCPLDLNFEAGNKVSFATNGKAHVHLTGYLITLDDDSSDEDAEEEEAPKQEKRRVQKEAEDSPPTKKAKKTNLLALQQEIDDDTSDSDFDINQLEQEEVEGEASDEEDEDEEGAEEEDEDLSSLSNEEESIEEEEEEVKPKQNGISKANTLSNKKTKEQKLEGNIKGKSIKQEETKQKKAVLKGGVIIHDLKDGNGEPVKEGKLVHVYYEGRLKDSNEKFDSTTKGPGFRFRVGKGEVIKGWDLGLIGMRVGGKRRITCPPRVAYGVEGSPPVIPPNSTLVFDIELKKIS